METSSIYITVPANTKRSPAGRNPTKTARRLARENRILRRTCAACLAAMFTALAWYAWDGWQTRKTYDLLKTSAQLTAQSAEQRAEGYRAAANLLQNQLDEAELRADTLQQELDALRAVTGVQDNGNQ